MKKSVKYIIAGAILAGAGAVIADRIIIKNRKKKNKETRKTSDNYMSECYLDEDGCECTCKATKSTDKKSKKDIKEESSDITYPSDEIDMIDFCDVDEGCKCTCPISKTIQTLRHEKLKKCVEGEKEEEKDKIEFNMIDFSEYENDDNICDTQNNKSEIHFEENAEEHKPNINFNEETAPQQENKVTEDKDTTNTITEDE
jgi:hypothetical protein